MASTSSSATRLPRPAELRGVPRRRRQLRRGRPTDRRRHGPRQQRHRSGAGARITGVDLRGYQQMRLVLAVGSRGLAERADLALLARRRHHLGRHDATSARWRRQPDALGRLERHPGGPAAVDRRRSGAVRQHRRRQYAGSSARLRHQHARPRPDLGGAAAADAGAAGRETGLRRADAAQLFRPPTSPTSSSRPRRRQPSRPRRPTPWRWPTTTASSRLPTPRRSH